MFLCLILLGQKNLNTKLRLYTSVHFRGSELEGEMLVLLFYDAHGILDTY